MTTYSLLRRTSVIARVAVESDDVVEALRHWTAQKLVPEAPWTEIRSDGAVCGWLCSMTFGNGAPLIAMPTPCDVCNDTQIAPDSFGNDCEACTYQNEPDHATLGADLEVVIDPDGDDDDGDDGNSVSAEPVIDGITHDEFCDDLITTFVEGGVYSWFNVKDYKWAEGQPTTAKVRHDRSEEGEKNGPWVQLDAALVNKGLARIKAGPVEGLAESYRARIVGCDATHDSGNLDINDVDVIMQVAMFDEVIYA